MKQVLLILSLVIGILLFGCAGSTTPPHNPKDTTEAPAEYQKITAERAKEIMDETDSWILLDVRTDEEFESKRIEGAILIPDYEISSRVENEISDKDSVILIYCRSGRRSAIAAHEMVDMGYTNVYDFGGIIDWPYDTISGE